MSVALVGEQIRRVKIWMYAVLQNSVVFFTKFNIILQDNQASSWFLLPQQTYLKSSCHLKGSKCGSVAAACEQMWKAKIWVAVVALHYLHKTVFSVPQSLGRQ